MTLSSAIDRWAAVLSEINWRGVDLFSLAFSFSDTSDSKRVAISLPRKTGGSYTLRVNGSNLNNLEEFGGGKISSLALLRADGSNAAPEVFFDKLSLYSLYETISADLTDSDNNLGTPTIGFLSSNLAPNQDLIGSISKELSDVAWDKLNIARDSALTSPTEYTFKLPTNSGKFIQLKFFGSDFKQVFSTVIGATDRVVITGIDNKILFDLKLVQGFAGADLEFVTNRLFGDIFTRLESQDKVHSINDTLVYLASKTDPTSIQTSDTTPPEVSSISINKSILTLTLSESLKDTTLDTSKFVVRVDGKIRRALTASVNKANKIVVLNLASAVNQGQKVTLAYNDRNPNLNDITGVIEDSSGNDLASFTPKPVLNITPDELPPQALDLSVKGNKLALTLNEILKDSIPANSLFSAKVEGLNVGVIATRVDSKNKQVILTLASPVAAGKQVTLAYKDKTIKVDDLSGVVEDASGNDLASFAPRSVVNAATVLASISTTLNPTSANLTLSGTRAINGTGNSLDNTIVGNSNNNTLSGLKGKDVLIDRNTSDSDVFAYNSRTDSLLGNPNNTDPGRFDIIIGFTSKDRILPRFSIKSQRLTKTKGDISSLTSTSISSLLTESSFAGNSVAAFNAKGHSGTFIALNDSRPGFREDSDSIIFLQNHVLSSSSFVDFIQA